MNFRVVDGDGRVLGEGRRLGPLQHKLSDRARTAFCVKFGHMSARGLSAGISASFRGRCKQAPDGVSLRGFPGLVDCQDAVAIRVFDSRERAEREHRAGLRRLFRPGITPANQISEEKDPTD